MHSGGPIEDQLIFVIIALSEVSATRGVELTSLASMAQVMCSVSSLMGLFEWNLDPSFVTDRHSPHVAFYYSLTRLLVDA